MSSDPALLPAISQQTALERRLAIRILKINPGLGPKAAEIANALSDSGLSPTATTMLMSAVYAPNYADGRGQSTRIKWFIEAVSSRYSHKLDKIRNDPNQFKIFVSEMEEVTEMRDILNGEGYSISFQSAFLLWELGYNAETVMATIQEVAQGLNGRPRLATALVVRAAQMVKAGHFMEMETAIDAMRYGYEYEH